MSKTQEALKLALEALEPRPGMPNPEYESLMQCAITAIREALAEQTVRQQVLRAAHGNWGAKRKPEPANANAGKPWVGLTDEQIQAIAFEAVKDNWDWLKFARAIEAKLNEKNGGGV